MIILTNSKTIFPWNITTTSKKTTTSSTQTTTPIETSTVLNISTTTIFDTPITTTTIDYEEETTTTTSILKNKSYEYQSNFSRNNDSVFVSLHANTSDLFVSINNTFTSNQNDNYPCEILFNEHSINSNNITQTKIFINFNGSFTRDLAVQLGDRLTDMADLLLTVRSMTNQNNTVDTV